MESLDLKNDLEGLILIHKFGTDACANNGSISLYELAPSIRLRKQVCWRFSNLAVNQIIRRVAMPSSANWFQSIICFFCVPFVFRGCIMRRLRMFAIIPDHTWKPIAIFSTNKRGEIGNLAVMNFWILFRLILEEKDSLKKALRKVAPNVSAPYLYAVAKDYGAVANALKHLNFSQTAKEIAFSVFYEGRSLLSKPRCLLMWWFIRGWARIWCYTEKPRKIGL